MKKLILSSWFLAAVILIAGGVLLFFGIADYGFSFFVIFPIVVGFSIGNLNYESQKKAQWFSIIAGVIISLLFLSIVGIEGIICVGMALPLIAVLMVIGFWIARTYRKYANKKSSQKPSQLNSILIPLVILIISNAFEHFFFPKPELNVITNSMVLPYPSEIVFDMVKEMDKLDGEKPWLLKMGLPTPYKCELEGNWVGAKRVCLFENGRIVAEVTEFKRGERLRMNVNEYTLTGNQWFKFNNAEYFFEKKGDETVITRNTTYQSTLRPRIYWQPFESYGIEQEHLFVLESLKKNLKEKYQTKPL